MNISDVMKPHHGENAQSTRARVLLIFALLSSLLSVAIVINARMKKLGMRWKRANASAVVAVRVHYINADWRLLLITQWLVEHLSE